ncbi:MAG: hypothetical protein EXR45_09595 [Chloroflexi bacterium]|nr:hypothetical protein [Chloroflexota bacterium]
MTGIGVARILSLLDARTPFCLVTVVASGSDSVLRVGGKIAVFPDGTCEGRVGSDGLTGSVVDASLRFLGAEEPAEVRFSIDGAVLANRRRMRDREASPDTVELLFESCLPPPRLVIVGAGHIAVPLCALGAVLDYEVTVIDDRARFATRERFPAAHSIMVDDFVRAIDTLEITPWTYLVLVTRGHEHDEATLQRVAGSTARYIGMIGSRRRVLVVLERLRRAGVEASLLSKVYAPIGLDLGGRAPTEIALAIMAEIVNVRRRGGAMSLARFIHSEVGGGGSDVELAEEA